jgi:hypothetical protein
VRDSVAVWTERPLSVPYSGTSPRFVNRIVRRVLEECEYGDDPAVDRRGRDAELGEDRVDVLLNCRLGKKQGLLNACIGLALGHPPEDIEFTRSQGAERA